MTDSEDQDDQEDPDEKGGAHATVDEVAAEFARLGRQEWDRIELIARQLAKGSALDEGDLVNTVVERLLTPGRRRWHRKETIFGCLGRTMKSIVQDWWRRQQIVEIVTEADAPFLQDEDGDETGIIDRARSDDADPERLLMARQALEEVFAALKDDNNTLEIALALANGDKPEEIRYAYDLTETDYDTALQRIRRVRKKLRTPGGRS